MTINVPCPLCKYLETTFFITVQGKDYYRCPCCDGIFLHPSFYITKTEEKERYKIHQNNTEDKGYQNFVAPIVRAVKSNFQKNSIGLDFGSGTGPVITKILAADGYALNLYDPFFYANKAMLTLAYDYVVCCEVAEHFHKPHKEFKMLWKLLKPGGYMYLKTNLYSNDINFENWWYKNDKTHVFFYTKNTFIWLSNHFNMALITNETTLVTLKKR